LFLVHRQANTLIANHFAVLGEQPSLDLPHVLALALLYDCLPDGGALLLHGHSFSVKGSSIATSVSRVRIDPAHGIGVLEEVDALFWDEASRLGVYDGLNAIRLNDAANVRIGEDGTREEVALLESGRLVSCAKDNVELVEGVLGPDDEATQVSSWSQLQ